MARLWFSPNSTVLEDWSWDRVFSYPHWALPLLILEKSELGKHDQDHLRRKCISFRIFQLKNHWDQVEGKVIIPDDQFKLIPHMYKKTKECAIKSEKERNICT